MHLFDSSITAIPWGISKPSYRKKLSKYVFYCINTGFASTSDEKGLSLGIRLGGLSSLLRGLFHALKRFGMYARIRADCNYKMRVFEILFSSFTMFRILYEGILCLDRRWNDWSFIMRVT